MFKVRQLNYMKALYWDVIKGDEDQDGIGLFGTFDSAQHFADNLNAGKPVSSIYDRLKGDDDARF